MKIRGRLVTYAVAGTAVKLFHLLFRTLRIQFHFARPEVNPYATVGPERFIYSVWHDAVTVSIFGGRHPRTVALVSRHQDGSFLAKGLQIHGVRTVRGSSKHGGAVAARSLIADTYDQHIVITPDGPRGPRRQVKAGIVFIASHTGKAIVPTAFTYDRFWRIRGSWTDLTIPKPWAKVHSMAGEPIHVPPDLTREQIEHYTAVVQKAMDELNELAEALVSGEAPAAPTAKLAA